MATAPVAAAPAATPTLPWRELAKKRLTDELAELRIGLADDIKKIEEETAADGTYTVRSFAYRVIVGVYLVAQLVLGGVALYNFSVEVELADGFAIYPMLMLLLLQALHLVASLRTIKVDDLAGIDFFVRPLFEPKTGLYVVPRFILTLTITNRNYRDVRFPGHPDKIFRISAEAQQKSPTGDMPPAGDDLGEELSDDAVGDASRRGHVPDRRLRRSNRGQGQWQRRCDARRRPGPPAA